MSSHLGMQITDFGLNYDVEDEMPIFLAAKVSFRIEEIKNAVILFKSKFLMSYNYHLTNWVLFKVVFSGQTDRAQVMPRLVYFKGFIQNFQ